MLKLDGVIGIGKSVEVNDDTIKIKLGMLNTLGRSREKVIPISKIVSVQVKKAGLQSGYIYFQTIGGLDNTSIKSFEEIKNDENSILFNSSKKYKIALQIKEFVEGYKQTTSTGDINSVADEILKFKELLDNGIITQGEFEKQKNKLLNK